MQCSCSTASHTQCAYELQAPPHEMHFHYQRTRTRHLAAGRGRVAKEEEEEVWQKHDSASERPVVLCLCWQRARDAILESRRLRIQRHTGGRQIVKQTLLPSSMRLPQLSLPGHHTNTQARDQGER